jgi:CPA2 family monovalent cation:H+ antiporter-2
LQFVVVEVNRRLVDSLRERGVTAIHGDASAHGVLDLARVQHARLQVIAPPDGFQARRILELARARNPSIATIVRTHSASELALEMTDYAPRSLGVEDERCKQVLQVLRDERAARSGEPVA